MAKYNSVSVEQTYSHIFLLNLHLHATIVESHTVQLQRNSKGQFLPSPVKLGTKVLCTASGFNPGFTFYKVYEVVGTARSNNHTIEKKLKTPTEFVLIDDDGCARSCDLLPKTQYGFPKWEIYNESRRSLSADVAGKEVNK